MSQPLRLGVPRGTLFEETLNLLDAIGVDAKRHGAMLARIFHLARALHLVRPARPLAPPGEPG